MTIPEMIVTAAFAGACLGAIVLAHLLYVRSWRASRAYRYRAEAGTGLRSRVNAHQSAYRRRDRQIRRNGARLAWWTCPPTVVLFVSVAWLNFSQGDTGTGLIYVAGALVFLVMLVVAQEWGK